MLKCNDNHLLKYAECIYKSHSFPVGRNIIENTSNLVMIYNL